MTLMNKCLVAPASKPAPFIHNPESLAAQRIRLLNLRGLKSRMGRRK